MFLAVLVMGFLAACDDRDYPAGVEELEHHYYIGYIPYNNSVVSVNRTQSALVKFPVQFNSSFTRDYDAVGQYVLSTTGITSPAVLGQDFQIVDKDGNVKQGDAGKYSFTFPQAKRTTDTIYVKILNSSVAGTRRVEVNLSENVSSPYTVDIFSTAFKRTLEIK